MGNEDALGYIMKVKKPIAARRADNRPRHAATSTPADGRI